MAFLDWQTLAKYYDIVTVMCQCLAEPSAHERFKVTIHLLTLNCYRSNMSSNDIPSFSLAIAKHRYMRYSVSGLFFFVFHSILTFFASEKCRSGDECRDPYYSTGKSLPQAGYED